MGKPKERIPAISWLKVTFVVMNRQSTLLTMVILVRKIKSWRNIKITYDSTMIVIIVARILKLILLIMMIRIGRRVLLTLWRFSILLKLKIFVNIFVVLELQDSSWILDLNASLLIDFWNFFEILKSSNLGRRLCILKLVH